MSDDAFWRKPLAELNSEEWEALCDGCAQCCQLKLEDEDTGRIACTSVTCHLLDLDTCRCTQYEERHVRVRDCIEFDAAAVPDLHWLPQTCAYRLRSEGRDLMWWHYLVSGDRDTVHRAGISVRGRAMSEAHVHPDDMESRILHWIEPKKRSEP
ncbi:MAG TPA: YcgN family cysteine cluster protein [Pseudomonadales bacterium]|nr:YcgN family cysteine cluster protein [Pseudomonadales bacterium]